ncbi:hypothetical protein OQY15_17275 [Pedobacter sp. MC2016-15]|uniref:DUF7935 family protein n=1 Tax=Pedobacter sp. MC2016-15 TaxID=2994473 RepID=UPI00224552C5|nr:hypothetical protein [Pedobacter sp. MC2016-15]MCX2480860.1 hypothetical protein [Pedobacter sp. MC2016-15]
MNLQYFLTQVAVHAAGGLIMITGSWYLLKNDIIRYFRKEPAASKEEDKVALLQLRLQAHERMIVFVDRLNPSNLFIRLYEQGVPAVQLQARILNEVRTEYQHNVSQQLYINAASWNVLRKLKDDTIAMINNAAGTLPADASGRDLSRTVLEHVAGIAENPYDLTIQLIKQDIHQMF